MKYIEYKKSAARHYLVCDNLLIRFRDLMNQGNEVDAKKILLGIYYISGYIYECGIKYKILELCCHDENIDVSKQSCSQYSFNYHNDFKIHSLSKLIDLLDVLAGSDARNEITEVDAELFNNWSPEVRYQESIYDEQKVLTFYNKSSSMIRA
ncbi:hypothetical protein [Enterobacter asburiae]|uniref:hypothetical protein n=1 Tax=Enterobacter asburiae TaxID=61645 RepID=UPI0018816654|nr:hypothetical protein [Enterobacter asburiae]MBE8906843.1 hypothetical protein [Enterobacter asburiae]